MRSKFGPSSELAKECNKWSKSVMEMGMVKKLKEKATLTLRASKQWDILNRIDPSMPLTRFRKMQVDLTKGQAAIYIQLCTGHAPLNEHLYRLKAINSPVCTGCNRAHGSVKHYLMNCPRTVRLWAKITEALEREAWSIKTLLSHPKALKPLTVFIGISGRFGNTYGTMVLQEPAAKKGKRKE